MKCSLKIHLIDHPDEQQRFQQRYEEACRYIDELARRASTQQ